MPTSDPGKPDIQSLNLVWRCYQLLRTRPSIPIAAIAEQLGKKPDALYRAIAASEKFADVCLFRRSRGHNAEIAPGSEGTFQRIAELCLLYEQVFSGTMGLRVRVGTGTTFGINTLSRILRNYYDHVKDVDVELAYHQPSELREMERAGELDLVVTEYPERLRLEDGMTPFLMKMALIVPHGHSLIEKIRSSGRFHDDMITDCAVAVLANRRDAPAYPPCIRDKANVRILRFGTYAFLHAVVAAGGAVTFSLPQLMSDAQRACVQTFPYDGAETVRIALIRSTRMSIPRSSNDAERIEHLAKLLSDELERMADQRSDTELQQLPQTAVAYYVVRTKDSGIRWVKGNISCQYSRDLTFEGVYEMEGLLDPGECSPDDVQLYTGPRRYEIQGYLVPHLNSGQIHVVSQGMRVDRDREVFSAQYLAKSEDDVRRPMLVGTWIGREHMYEVLSDGTTIERYVPATGFTVLLDPDTARTIRDSAALDSIVREYRKSYNLALSLPSDTPAAGVE